MRKLLTLAAVCGSALVVAVSPASTAKIDDTNGGPVCADITNDSGVSDYSNSTLTFVLSTVAPSCRGLTYTVSAYDDTTGVLLGTGSAPGNKTPQIDGSGFVFVTVPIDTSKASTDPIESFCIVATSGDDRVFDRAPDAGCISFPVSSSGGQSGFN
jgi:hypothetical protein